LLLMRIGGDLSEFIAFMRVELPRVYNFK
jgi:hypothetical protein